MVVERGHLRGSLDILLSGDPAGAQDDARLPVSRIDPGQYQPRSRFDEQRISQLAESIAQNGVLQPVLVRPTAGGRYELIAGERRLRAAKVAGLEAIPCVIREATDGQALGLALVENIQREDLSALEEARALRRLVDEFSLSHAQAGEIVGRSRTAVSNLLRLLELEASVQVLLEEGRLFPPQACHSEKQTLEHRPRTGQQGAHIREINQVL